MEVELQQIVAVLVDVERAAGRHIDLNGVTVVEHFERAILVVHAEHVFGFFKRSDNVQWRLFFASATDGKVVAPMFWAVVAFIAPMHLVGLVVFFASPMLFGGVFFVNGLFTVRQNLDILTRRRQGVLRGTHGLQTIRPFGHFKGFGEGRDGAFVLRAFGEQTHRRQTNLAFGADGFLRFVEHFHVLQHHAVGERGFQGIQFLVAASGFSRVFFGCSRLFLALFFECFFGFAKLLSQFTHFGQQVFFGRVVEVSQGCSGHKANAQQDFQNQSQMFFHDGFNG